MTAIIINSNELPVQTVTPNLSIGEVQLSADRRSTKETPVPEADRIRRVVLPANHWEAISATINDQRSQALTDILRNALIRIGSERLKDALAESPMLRTVKAADYTVAALLAWSEETATSRGSITFTRQDVETWFDASATRNELANKHAANPKLAALLALVRNRFGALAAKNHGLKDEADALKLATLVAEADHSTALTADILARLEHIAKQLAARAAEDTVSMDDL